MEKLNYLKKMYVEGKIEGENDGEVLKFESLEALKQEIKSTMKRKQEIEDLAYESFYEETEKEIPEKEEKSKESFDDYLKKHGWKIYKMKWSIDPFAEWINEWPFPRRKYHL